MNPRVGKKSNERQRLQICSPIPGPSGVFSSSQTGDQSADLKQIDSQIFPQQWGIYAGSAENCNSGSATWQDTCVFPQGKGRSTLYRGKEEVQRALVNKESVVSLAESLPGKKMSLSSPSWALLSQHMRAPPSAFLTLFS